MIEFDVVEDLGRQVVKINENSSTSIFMEFRRKKNEKSRESGEVLIRGSHVS